MTTLYDDNFGHYDPGDDPEETARFYKQVQKESVVKICKRCGRKVRLRPSYAYCNSCADKMERGYDLG